MTGDGEDEAPEFAARPLLSSKFDEYNFPSYAKRTPRQRRHELWKEGLSKWRAEVGRYIPVYVAASPADVASDGQFADQELERA